MEGFFMGMISKAIKEKTEGDSIRDFATFQSGCYSITIRNRSQKVGSRADGDGIF